MSVSTVLWNENWNAIYFLFTEGLVEWIFFQVRQSRFFFAYGIYETISNQSFRYSGIWLLPGAKNNFPAILMITYISRYLFYPHFIVGMQPIFAMLRQLHCYLFKQQRSSLISVHFLDSVFTCITHLLPVLRISSLEAIGNWISIQGINMPKLNI